MSKPSKSSKRFYITTTLPYVNAEPHLGHAMEFIRADIIARYQALQGNEVLFNTGTDEHGLKIYRKAIEDKVSPQAYVDQYAEKFVSLLPKLGITDVVGIERHFSRTTDPRHVHAAQEFWRRCQANGFIKKKKYSVKYCVGCELEKTDSELVDGACPIHPNLKIEIIDEENYFFLLSEFTYKLTSHYEDHPHFVIPNSRFNEIKSFVSRGLEDFSISRLKAKMSWGVPVPGDEDHVMYVWFDALVSYISNIGWPDDEMSFAKWWKETGGVVQYCGKDNLRQQSAMWQAMLMAADLPASKQIVINGFVTGAGGLKMSKSLGNVVNPLDLISEYGTDALRYYVARELEPFEDSPFTTESFKDAYNAHLANGIGNLVSRVMKMATTYGVDCSGAMSGGLPKAYADAMDNYDISSAANVIWEIITASDKRIHETEPFKLIKTDPDKAKAIVSELVINLDLIATLLEPIIPETAKKIKECLTGNKMPTAPLFLRK